MMRWQVDLGWRFARAIAEATIREVRASNSRARSSRGIVVREIFSEGNA